MVERSLKGVHAPIPICANSESRMACQAARDSQTTSIDLPAASVARSFADSAGLSFLGMDPVMRLPMP
jgi:hypothetical protein